ncbi:MAG: hypothetical protein H0T95_11135 [Chthoniobacterales bacterium]|nr:hypothetical protein [Chthoniobacterales bacterium]
MTVIDVTIIAALAAGSFAATKELARRIGEVEFNALYQQGNGSHIFINSVDEARSFYRLLVAARPSVWWDSLRQLGGRVFALC